MGPFDLFIIFVQKTNKEVLNGDSKQLGGKVQN